MKTYQTPELSLHGKVEQLTGIIGVSTGGDQLIVNGVSVAQRADDEAFSNDNCIFFDSGLGNDLSYVGSGAGGPKEDACTQALQDWQDDGVVDGDYTF